MQRIMTIGGTGSGRSTLARTLGRCLDLSVVPIDPVYRAPRLDLAGWQRYGQSVCRRGRRRVLGI